MNENIRSELALEDDASSETAPSTLMIQRGWRLIARRAEPWVIS